jgi:hypothetical protein
MSHPQNNKEDESAESKDQLIADLMEQRKLQKEALLKIKTSMEKEQEALQEPTGEEPAQKKRLLEKIFSTDKKPKNNSTIL